MWQNPGERGQDAEGRDKRTNGIDDDGNGYIDDFRGWDFTNNDNNPMDDNKHGTHCAGIIGAVADNGIGIAGVNWQASLVAIKFINERGTGSLSNALKSVEYAIQIGAHLTNNSWNLQSGSETLKLAINTALKKGMLFVTAAGNNKSNADRNANYPGAYQLVNTVSVAASDNNNQLAGFSSRGRYGVDITAPGVDIFSTIPNNSYRFLSGTSMAAPLATGMLALAKSLYPSLSVRQLKNRLIYSSVAIESLHDSSLARGLVNLNNLLKDDFQKPSSPSGIYTYEKGPQSVSVAFDSSSKQDTPPEALRYQIKISESPIDSEADWQQADYVDSQFSYGDKMTAQLSNLPVNFVGYLAVRAIDPYGNFSELSQPRRLVTKRIDLIYSNEANDLRKMRQTGDWGLQDYSSSRGSVFSDSPEGVYQNKEKSYLRSSRIKINRQDLIFSYDIKYDLEKFVDFVYLEIRTSSNNEWQEVRRFNGTSVWHTRSDLLEEFLNESDDWLQFRFRVNTSILTQMDGILLDRFRLFSKQELEEK